jgi:DNA (cytosine-5)-methyltransferase 1
MTKPIPVIDLFAGPGGLAEGFSRAEVPGRKPAFRVCLSIEKDPTACRTLKLRSFYRDTRANKRARADYFGYLRGDGAFTTLDQLFAAHPAIGVRAEQEVFEATLGPDARPAVERRIKAALKAANGTDRWVLIGGPPCQAYSLVGRARMRGALGDEFYKDKRHTLYKEYLHIIETLKPTAFVMENVKGLLSSQLEGDFIFKQILEDLAGTNRRNLKYRLFALADAPELAGLPEGDLPPPTAFLLRSEEYGIPQTRHRIIVIGILEGEADGLCPDALKLARNYAGKPLCISAVIDGLPKLRSGISKPKSGKDSPEAWAALVREFAGRDWAREFALAPPGAPHSKQLRQFFKTPTPPTADRGGRYVHDDSLPRQHKDWFHAPELGGACNHETRGHIAADLERYLFLSCTAATKKHSPRLQDFPRDLLPKHRNARLADTQTIFNDRFRVQLAERPAATITSHISKDGHYFVHPDFTQMRSLTVREAARIQTFPDDYFFEGPRTEQYKQVGNAVPPLLARSIAVRLARVLL